MSGESLLTLAQRPALRRRLRALRGGRREPRLRPDRRAEARASPRRRGGRGRGPRRGHDPGRRRRAGARRGDPGVVVKGARTSGSSWPAAALPCPATRSSASSPAATACRCTAPTAPTSQRAAAQPRPAWSRSSGRRGDDSVFLVAIQVEALDRPRLLSDVTRALSDQHVNILSASVTTTRDRVAISRFTFEMGDPKHLGHVLKAVRSVDGRLRRLPRQRRRSLTPPRPAPAPGRWPVPAAGADSPVSPDGRGLGARASGWGGRHRAAARPPRGAGCAVRGKAGGRAPQAGTRPPGSLSGQENSARVRSASSSQARRAVRASWASLTSLSLAGRLALARRVSNCSIDVRSWSTVFWARARASGLERFHSASSALRTASSILRSPPSRRSR